MKKTKRQYRKLITLLILIISVGMVNAQHSGNFISEDFNSYYFNPQNIGISNPQSSDFIRYGNLSPNYYNGLLDMDIELKSYKDNDFDLPMSLKYVSTGFIPSKKPSMVGYNWFLNFGGMITRTVKGSPDDTKGNSTNNSMSYIKDGLLVAIRNNSFRNYTQHELLNFNVDRKNSLSVPYSWNDFIYDMEPDIFNFSFGTHSGYFIIGNNGNPISLSKGYKIDISRLTIQEYSTTGAPQASTIVITAPDGSMYEFGGNTTYLEYTIPNNPDRIAKKSRHIISWYLKTITAPNGRAVEFTYDSKSQTNSYNYFLYSESRGTRTTLCDNSSEWNVPHNIYKIKSQITVHDQVFSPIIKQVSIGNDIYINFSYQRPGSFLSNVSFKESNIIKDHINLSYNSIFLTQLKIDDKTYKFDYNLPVRLPDALTTSLDHWGFWNGGYETTVSDLEDYCQNIETYKNTSGNFYNVGLLSRVTYPTGGYSEIFYEANRYDQYLVKELGEVGISLKNSTTSTICGGARISQIRDHDTETSKHSNHRTFKYINPQTNRGSGIIGYLPKYKSTEFINYSTSEWSDPPLSCLVLYTNNYIDISANSLGVNENLAEYHIGYSSVIEEFSDGSYIHYQYTSNTDIPNTMNGTTYKVFPTPRVNGSSTLTDIEIREKSGLYITNDLSHFRGKLRAKTYYNSSNTCQQTERYTYNTHTMESSYNISLCGISRGMASYRIYLTPCLLTKKEITDSNGVNYIEEYQYNNNSIISEKKKFNSTGEEICIQFDYPSDLNYSNLSVAEKKLIDKNMLIKPFQIKRITRTGVLSSKVLETLSFEYKIEYNLPLLNRIKKSDGTNNFTIVEEYPEYDTYGNPVCVIKDNATETVYLWGYKGKYLIAEIKNSSYDAVSSQIVVQRLSLDDISTFSYPPFGQINALRQLIPSAHITTYSYSHLGRIQSITDPRGIVTNYTYDIYGRLKDSFFMEDNKKRILEAYEYNYTHNKWNP